ncbi:MAG TPA: type II and III secretion system protein family protein [Allosphingosinicella sp.]|jgi:pilus assembly protein CpaC|nr:type II and III secretion system protein family protein [Allosphingosinicella sp.]
MITSILNRATLGTATAALLAASLATAPAPLLAAPGYGPAPVRPASDLTLSVGTGEMVRLPAAISDLFVADDKVADVQVRSPNQIYVFGKGPGVTTVFATDKAGRTVYSANVHVGSNMADVGSVIRAAMPEAQIQVQTFNGIVVLSGTVASPADVEQATSIVQGVVGKDVQVISRLKTATPLQVMLQVRVAEVSRSLVKSIGFNLLNRDHSGGFLFGIGQGNAGTITTVTGTTPDPTTGALPGSTAYKFNTAAGATSLGFAGHLLGLDLLSTLDLAENDGRSHTLAEPTLTALSGETASFLAGGEFPIATTNGLSGTSIEYKQYGVSLAFTPTVLEGGRIAMRVRPEVSQLSDQGAIVLSGIKIPALTTRRTETTVELGSGQSFMIAGLLNNSSANTTNKAPFLGSLPIIGALFKSNSFQRNETELVIVVTPYLVHPVNANDIALPTDGYRAPGTLERVLTNTAEHRTGETRPKPSVAPAQQSAPSVGSVGDPVAPLPTPIRKPEQQAAIKPQQQTTAAPGFSF